MHIASIGIDIGKTTFHLVALDEHGSIVVRKKFSRQYLLAYTANLPASLTGIEACGDAYCLARSLHEQGHAVRLIPGQFVKPFRKSNKNDYLDAEAIAEAVTRHNMRFVPIKTEDQLDLQGLHRVRERLVHNRTEVINQIRGFLLERGITFNRGPASLRKEMPSLLEDAEQNLTPSLRTLLDHLWRKWQYLDSQVDQMSLAIEEVADRDAACRRLRKIPGVGPLVATATVAAVGNGAAFRRGREFAAWLGLVPKQHSTGGKAKLLGITKRGNPYLRKLFVPGARAVLLRVKYDTGGFGQWVTQAGSQSTAQQGHCGDCQQIGEDRLGGAVQRQRVSAPAASSSGLRLAGEKTLSLGKHKTLSTLPPPPRREIEMSSTEVS
jgi:transposase